MGGLLKGIFEQGQTGCSPFSILGAKGFQVSLFRGVLSYVPIYSVG